LGVLALAGYSAKSNYSSTPPAAADGKSTTHQPRSHSQACDPVSTNPLQCAADTFFGHRVGESPQFHLSLEESSTVRFVIATVPDPVHTDMALLFDRFVEAIGQGAQEAGYTFDHAVLPWQVPSDSLPDTKSEKGSKEESEKSVRQRQERENTPGLLIFRNTGATVSPRDLFVLLVGETPTSGIHKEQFNRALDIIRDPTGRQGPARGELPKQIDIIGPTFSGSLYSLRVLLNGAKQFGAPHFRIRSGTAMSSTAISWFNETSRKLADADLLTFKDTDAYEIDRFIEYEEHQGYNEDEIVLISEDETVLGALSTQDRSLDEPHPRLVRVYFPREISELRAAYQGYPALSAGADDASAPRSKLKLNLDSTGSNDDSVPTYSGKQSAISQEAVLMGIITVLRVHPHHFVLLRATDPKDLIFLTRFLRTNFPQDRIVTMSADQLLPRDINDTVFRGVLSLTNYPLLPRQLTDYPSRPHRVFASTECAGLFNATLALLKEKETADNQTLPSASYTEYTPPILGHRELCPTDRRPVVWLTVMGDDGYWPLTALVPASEVKPPSVLRPCRDCPDPGAMRLGPSSFNQLIMIGLLAFSVVFIYLTWRADFKQRSNLHQQFAMMTDSTRGILIGAASLVLILAFVLLGSPWFKANDHWLSSENNYGPPLMVIAGAATVAISTTLNLLARGQRRAALLFAICSAVLCSPLVWISKADHLLKESILLYRMAWLQSGVSPTLPLLLICAALFLWVWFTLKLRSLFDLRRPWLPRGIPQLPSDDEHNTEEYTHVISRSRLFVALGVLLIAVVVVDNFHPLSLDGVRFDTLYLIFLLTCVLLIANSMFNAWSSWKKCRALLLHLDRTPLRWAFRRIQGFSWKPLWGFSGGDLMSAYKPLSRSLEAFAHLGAGLKGSDYKGQAAYLQNRSNLVYSDLTHLRNAFAGPVGTSRAGQLRRYHDDVINRMYALQKNLAVMCSLIWLAVLQKVWEADTRMVVAGPQDQLASTSDSDQADRAGEKSGANGHSVAGRQDQPALLAEEFLSLVYINFIHRVLIRIRWLILAASSAFVLLLFSAKVYPFEPKTAIDGFFILLFVAVGGVVSMIFAEMHRDAMLSHLTKTNPGELGSDFWIRIVGFGAVPLLSLVATQVPGLNRLFFHWLKPMIDALHK
jgi:hypothetical protein